MKHRAVILCGTLIVCFLIACGGDSGSDIADGQVGSGTVTGDLPEPVMGLST